MRDSNKVVRGLACSVLSEGEIGAVMRAPVQLMPTSGNICRYVATSGDTERSVIVVAHRLETPQPHLTYSLAVIEPQADALTADNERSRLAALIPREAHVAQR